MARGSSIDDAFRPRKRRAEHPLQWLIEPLVDDPTFELNAWFGGRTVTLDGRRQLVLMAQGEPWQGLLICTTHDRQAALRADFAALVPHPVLGKWLYLSEAAPSFERDARALVDLVRARDPRIGIVPAVKKKRATRRIRFGDPL